MKRHVIFCALAVVVLIGIALPTVNAFATPGDSANDPIHITNCASLQNINSTGLEKYYVLDNDFSCSISPFNTGTGFTPIGLGDSFTGTIDGQNHVVNGLTFHYVTNPSNIGLIASIGSTGVVENLTLANATDDTSSVGQEVGILAGDNSGTIDNVHASGTVNGDYYLGGLVADNLGTISHSSADVNVTGVYYMGGLVSGTSGTISHSFATGDLHSQTSGFTGGLAGWANGSAAIINCFATGDVGDVGLSGNNMGGLVGWFSTSAGTISGSYATGDVNGTNQTGGLVGKLVAGTITTSYATGNVHTDVDEAGGFVGEIDTGSISQSYATGNVTAEGSNSGGFVGYVGGGTISQSFATGNATATGSYVGGFAGYKQFGITSDTFARGNATGDSYVGGHTGAMGVQTIQNSYSTGTASRTGSGEVGGFLAEEDNGSVANSFWDEQTSGTTDSGGNELPKSTADMKTAATFTNVSWDFDTIWTINQYNDSYPAFSWYTPPVTANKTNDLNGDGVIDAEQNNVVGIVNGLTGKTIVLEADDGCVFSTIAMKKESALGAQDIAFDYPQGLTQFTVSGCGPNGFTAHIKLYFYGVINNSPVVRKFLSGSNAYVTVPNATIDTASIYGQTVSRTSFSVVDGSIFDSDGSANGLIVDPVGLGQSVLGAPATGEGGTANS